ncbi:unnamed protein product [Nyctereutes procyonoides]|uniref:(raccoon dog) hypothetical protein n=1 Tax=Nyctereutes procyonoides TaxID=34880 RepID=A0A811YIG6_NYCPR|nr:unnamed protein product [Nyctereutes procyonoides]
MVLIILTTLIDNLIVIISIYMVKSVEHGWHFGEVCKIHTSTDIMLSSASIFHLSFIFIDRYNAVCDPLRYKAKMSILVIFVMILVSWSLNFKRAEETYYKYIHCIGGCSVFFSKTSGVLAFMTSFYIPESIMLCIYSRIYFIAQGQARSINDANQTLQIGLKEKNGMLQSKERKAAKTLGIMMGIFLNCYIPPTWNDALVWFGYLNSTFNPMIYPFFYPWFRKALKITLFGKIFQKDSCRHKLFLESHS